MRPFVSTAIKTISGQEGILSEPKGKKSCSFQDIFHCLNKTGHWMHLRHAGCSGALKAFTELLFKTWALRFLPLCQLCFVSPSSRAAPGKSFAQPKAQPMDSHQNSPSLRPLWTFCPSESDGSILPFYWKKHLWSARNGSEITGNSAQNWRKFSGQWKSLRRQLSSCTVC